MDRQVSKQTERQTDKYTDKRAGRQTSRQTDLPTGSAVVPSEGEGEVSTANLAHGDTLVRDHDGSLGSKLPLDRELEVGERGGSGGKRERGKEKRRGWGRGWRKDESMVGEGEEGGEEGRKEGAEEGGEEEGDNGGRERREETVEGREREEGKQMSRVVYFTTSGTPTMDPRLKELLFFMSSFMAPISAWTKKNTTKCTSHIQTNTWHDIIAHLSMQTQ